MRTSEPEPAGPLVGCAGAPRLFPAYASGSCSIALLRQVIVLLPMYFYCPPKGPAYLTPMLCAAALTVARVTDVVSDPIVGYCSDRTRHRWGRRLPWIVWGTPLWLLSTVLLFLPPSGSDYALNFLWLSVMSTLFFTGMTAVQIPYTALLPEISRSEEQTVGISGWMGRFYILGVFLAVLLCFPLAARIGVAPTVGVLAGIAAVPFFFAVREIFTVEQRPVAALEPGLIRNAWSVMRQRAFLAYLLGHGLFIVGYYLMLVALPYLVTEVVGLPQAASAFFLFLALGVSLAATPLVTRWSLRYGKKAVLLGAMLLFALTFGYWFYLGRIPGLDHSLSLAEGLGFQAPWAARVSLATVLQTSLFFLLAGLSVAVQMVLPNAIVADLVLRDEAVTGVRREALVFGVQGGLEKNAVTLATYLSGVCLSYGKQAAHPDGIYLIGPVAAAASLLGCVVFLWYPRQPPVKVERAPALDPQPAAPR